MDDCKRDAAESQILIHRRERSKQKEVRSRYPMRIENGLVILMNRTALLILLIFKPGKILPDKGWRDLINLRSEKATNNLPYNSFAFFISLLFC